MSPLHSAIMVIAQVVIAAVMIALLVGLAAIAREARALLASLQQLTRHLDARLDPLEAKLTATLDETNRTLVEVRTAAARLGETTEFLNNRARDLGAIVKSVTHRSEATVSKAGSAAVGLKVGLAHLLEGLRKRKAGG